VTDDIDSGSWRTVDFSDEPLGAWEPSIDDDLWRERRHLHLYFQPVRQGDGERSLDGAPTKAGALEIRWRQIGVVHGPKELTGTVTARRGGDIHFFMRTDDGESWRVSMAQNTPEPRTGDRVTVKGRVEPWTVNNRLDWGVVTVTGRDTRAPASAGTVVTIEELNDHPASGARTPDRFAEQVRTEGTVRDLLRRKRETQLVLSDERGHSLVVNLLVPMERSLPETLTIGSRVSVAGIYVYVTLPLQSDGNVFTGITEPTLISPDASCLQILEEPVFWTPFRIYGVMAVLAGIILVAFVFIFVLRRTIRRQTAIIRETVGRRMADEAVLRERLRLSHDLHDEFQQFLPGAALHVRAAENWLGEDEAETRRQLAEARSVLKHMQSDLRMVLWDLHSESEGPGNVESLCRYIISRMPGWEDIVHFSSTGTERPLARTLSGALLMILQEAVANAMRHGKATQIDVSAHFEEDSFTMTVKDDGCGFDTAAPIPPGHFGIESMRERAVALSGEFSIVSSPGNGSTVCVRVPFPH